jgi:mono/diheme cytochrome c family protein
MTRLFLFVIFAVAFPVSLTAVAMHGRPDPGSPRTAAESYAKYCSSCHGKDGRAKSLKGRLKHARDLTDRSWQDDTTDERLFNAISNGKRKMPSFKKKLSEQDIDALVTYVRALKK